jgi:four helix bundle protein
MAAGPFTGGRTDMGDRINSYKDLWVFQNALHTAMRVYLATEPVVAEDRFSIIDPMRRSSRQVCTNIARAWRKRRFKTPFIAKLKESEGDACETQVWIEFARQCHYMDEDLCKELDGAYGQIIGQLCRMMDQPDKWLLRKSQNR